MIMEAEDGGKGGRGMPEATKSLASARNGDRRMEDSHRESKETRRMRGTRPPVCVPT